MKKDMNDYRYQYDAKDDVLYIQNSRIDVEESVESAEDIVLDLDKKGNVIGIEVFYASEFFNLFNKEIDKEFLESLKEASLEYKEFRNNIFLAIIFKSDKKIIKQIMPPLRKSEYVSPLLA